MPLLFFALFVYVIYTNFIGEESGCDRYASKYSCDYVENKAEYEVWYWFNVADNNPQDERYIGNTKGLSNCKALAVAYHNQNESFRPWNSRSYICALMKDGRRMEKHR